MSGPKISVYQLSAAQRKNLFEQMRCDQQSFVCAGRIKQLIGSLNGFGEQIEHLQSTLALLEKRTGGVSAEIDTLCEMQDELRKACSSFVAEFSSSAPKISGNYTPDEKALNEKKILLDKLKSIQSRAVLCNKKIEQTLSEINDKAKSGVDEVKSGIADDISAVSSFYIEQDETGEEHFARHRKVIEDKLRSMLASNECPADVKPDILGALSSFARIIDAEHLRAFETVTVTPLLKKYETSLERQRETIILYEEQKARYTALCSATQTNEKDFSTDNEGVESLNAEIALLEKRLVMQTEQGYISDCVNEAMSEMGYDLIGNRAVTKRSGKQFKNELFSYEDGTAINVTYDSDGQIAMELGGIDRADRIPTSDETDALCEHMESFCGDFKVFEEKLKAKGISVKSRVSMCPPSAEYAAIINVSDYSISSQKPIATISVKDKRKKSSSKQTLRREDN